MRYAALLRAINTPPRHVKMDRLGSVFEGLGYRNVATVIASGNVVFDAEPDDDLVPTIEAALENELGFDVPTFLLTIDELQRIIDDQPFDENAGPIEVSVLPRTPGHDAARAVEEAAVGPDHVAVIGRAVYWLRAGTSRESQHSEGQVMRTLGMPTTRRSLATMRKIMAAADSRTS
jgi:uncharacterized protein (DUF1697 family)